MTQDAARLWGQALGHSLRWLSPTVLKELVLRSFHAILYFIDYSLRRIEKIFHAAFSMRSGRVTQTRRLPSPEPGGKTVCDTHCQARGAREPMAGFRTQPTGSSVKGLGTD